MREGDGRAYLWAWDYTNSAWVKVKCDDEGIFRVETRHHDITQLTVTGTGLAVSGVVYLHWITVNPSGKASEVALTDSLESGATPIWGYTREAKDSEHVIFDPALKFSKGLYVETLVEMTALYIAYDIE